MNVLIEDFLSIEEVAIYLENYGYKYDLEKEYENKRLLSKIYDLTNRKKITATFYYHGMLREEINYFEMDEDNNGQPIKIPIHKEWSSKYVDNYFYIDRNFLKDIFIYEKEVKINKHVEEYGKNVSTSQDQDEFYHLSDDVQISLRDVRIPRHELENLFRETVSTNTTDNQIDESNQEVLDNNIPNNISRMGTPKIGQGKPKTKEELSHELNTAKATIEQQKTEIDTLNKRLEQKVNMPADSSKKEGQGDSLLILGAVMHCIKDVAKSNFTQDSLTQIILEKYKNVSGISKSTLDKKYSEAKSYLEQRHTP